MFRLNACRNLKERLAWWLLTKAIRYWVNNHMDQYEQQKFRDANGTPFYVSISYKTEFPEAFDVVD